MFYIREKERDYVLFAVTSHLRHSTLKLELNTSFYHAPFCKLMPRKCGTNIFAKKTFKHKQTERIHTSVCSTKLMMEETIRFMSFHT